MKDAMGIILTEGNETRLNELTELRSAAALPIAGRYRLIDFILSNMVNSGIINIGVTTQYNYSSLMDHIGTGKPWDLNRKNYGLFILPPYISRGVQNLAKGNIDVLHGVLPYLRRSRQKYVILSEGTVVFNMTFYQALEEHVDNGADITIVYNKADDQTRDFFARNTMLTVDDSGLVTDIEHHPVEPSSNNCSMGVYIVEKNLLMSLIENCVAHGEHDFVLNILIKELASLKIYGYKFDGYVGRVDTIPEYYQRNMDMLVEEYRNELFNDSRQIYTKVKDQVPAKYGDHAVASASMVADGCVIEGTIKNSVVFRGVHIGKGAVVTNSIIMQNTYIQDGCNLDSVVIDKECVIREGKNLIGQPNYPVIIRKRAII